MTVEMKILIVDAEFERRFVHARLLRGAGYTVIEAATGREGLCRARDLHPHIVLLEVMLPDVDGVEICRQLKTDPLLPAPYVLLLSSLITESEFQAMALEQGADGYIALPISHRELLARVALYVRLRQSEAHRLAERASYEQQLQERIVALEASEERFRGIVEHSHDGILLVDRDGTVMVWNHAQEEITGLRAEDVLGRPFWEVQFTVACAERKNPTLHDLLQAQLVGVLRGEDAPWLHRPSQNEIQRPDGTRRVIQSTIFPIATRLGIIIASITRDVTSRRQADEALRQAHDYLDAVITHLPIGIFVKEAATRRIILCNDACATLMGRNRADIIGTTADDNLPKEQADAVYQSDTLALTGKQLVETPMIEIPHPTQGMRRWHTRKYPILNAKGDAEYLLLIADDITERTRAEERLQQSEARYRALVEHQMDAVCRWLPDSTLTFVNQAYAGLAGDTPEKLLGTPWLSFVAEDLQQHYRDQIADQLRHPQVYSTEDKLCDPQGETRWLNWVNVPVLDEVGHLVEFQSVGRDITARRNADAALRESEERFRLITETITEVFWISDPRLLQSFYVSPAFEQVWGRSRASLYANPTPIMEAIHSEDRSRVIAELTARKQHGQPFSLDYRIIRPDGAVRWIANRGYPVHDESGAVLCYVGCACDITARKEAELSLQESETRFHHLFATLNSGVVIYDVDAEGRIFTFKEMNAAAERIGGLPREVALGQRVEVIFPGLAQIGFLDALHTAWVTGDTHHHATTLYQDDRLTIWVDNYLFKLPSGEVVAIFDDVSPRKNAEEALQQSHAQLRHLAQRLAEAEESERRRLARELHDQVGQNLAALGVTLNAINNTLAKEHSTHITEQFASAIRLVEQLTECIRHVMLELRPPVLDEYGILSALQWAGHLLHQQTGLTVDVAGTGASVRLPAAVETALYRIAQEALTNVMKHAQASTVFLTLEMTAESVRLVIADDGIGFAPATCIPADPAKHTCWGLLIMQERALGVGGTVKIESQPGDGAQIIVTIPRSNNDHDHTDCR